ncbi:MAG: ABC transporter ATP-binding protein [Lachnospiraceae bacterium]|nr:ABC transporter ATP-binding protein [Lachnospiraceae bacterium]
MTLSDNAIELKNVKKKFKVYYDKGTALKDKLLFWSRNKYEENWVLNDISFNIKKGEAVGLIGRNGCGKSTTLKLINRIIYPTSGEIVVNGRVSSLIELGAGFHPDMTGRENIYTNASIFGMTREEIDEKIDDIIEFSELGEHIDNPVRTYSSGMYMRLGFSVAINVKADILLIDEILAVGDVNFQSKCFEKLRELKASGVTIVIVSHSMAQIESICDKVVWIEKGNIKEIDTPSIVGAHYSNDMENERMKTVNNEIDKSQSGGNFNCSERTGNGDILIKELYMYKDNHEENKHVFTMGEHLNIEIAYECKKEKTEGTDFRLSFVRSDGVVVYGISSLSDKAQIDIKDRGKIIFNIDKLSLLPGKYYLDIDIKQKDDVILDYIKNAKEFYIENEGNDIGEFGVISMNHKWLGDKE